MADGERASDPTRPGDGAGREREPGRAAGRPVPPPPAASMKLRDELARYMDAAAPRP